jgi:hypothetical protein
MEQGGPPSWAMPPGAAPHQPEYLPQQGGPPPPQQQQQQQQHHHQGYPPQQQQQQQQPGYPPPTQAGFPPQQPAPGGMMSPPQQGMPQQQGLGPTYVDSASTSVREVTPPPTTGSAAPLQMIPQAVATPEKSANRLARMEEKVLVTRTADEETEDGRIRNKEAIAKIRDAWVYKQIRARVDEFTEYKQVSKVQVVVQVVGQYL